MSKSKSEDQQIVELESIEIPGTLNPWEAKQDRYTNSILGESAGTDFSQQTLSNLIRRDKNRLENVQNRVCLVVSEGEPSSYDKVRYNMNKSKDNGEPVELKKIYTRNAESKTYFVTPTWNYGESPFDEYQRGIMNEMNTVALIEKGAQGDMQITTGSYIEQIYQDQTQESAKVLSKHKDGVQNFPRVNNALTTFKSAFIETTQKETKEGQSSLAGPDVQTLPSGSLVKAVIAAGWNPEFNPCAVKAGTDQRPMVSVGRDRTNAPTVEKDGKTKGKPGEGSDFGPRYHPTNKTVKFHEGVDLGVQAGYPIVAVASGEISIIKMNDKVSLKGPEQPVTVHNCYVTIRHDLKDYGSLETDGYQVHTTYMHLIKVANSEVDKEKRLEVTDTVRAGQVIGYMGGGKYWPGSGNTTGPHLHFEIGVRKKSKKGNSVYDTYTLNGEEYLTNGGSMKLGAVDPIHFKYLKTKEFANSSEVLSKIEDLLPTKAQVERLKKEAEGKDEAESK